MASQNVRSTVQSRVQAIVAVVVNQITSCKQPQFRIYDVPVQVVILVGVIRDINVYASEVSCTIEDHTGSIKGFLRLETESEVADHLAGIKEDSYVQVFALVRVESDEKIVLIIKMFPVDDMNVITHHLLQHSAFLLEAEDEWKKQLASANTSAAALADSLIVTEENNQIERPTTSTALEFTNFQRLIFDIVKSENAEPGISKGTILRQFPSYQGHDVNAAIDFLINQGIIYYSVDQEHLKVAIPYDS